MKKNFSSMGCVYPMLHRDPMTAALCHGTTGLSISAKQKWVSIVSLMSDANRARMLGLGRIEKSNSGGRYGGAVVKLRNGLRQGWVKVSLISQGCETLQSHKLLILAHQ